MEITDATFLVRRVGTFVKNAKAVVIEHAGDKFVFPLCIKYDHSSKQVRDAKKKANMNKRQDGILNVCRKLFPKPNQKKSCTHWVTMFASLAYWRVKMSTVDQTALKTY